MSNKITIAGKEFEIPAPFAAGHSLTEGQASALNQVFAENVRNNMAKKVKEGATQDDVSTYANGYEFGVRAVSVGGIGVARDPVMREAISLAKTAIKAKLKEQGKEATKDQINELAAKLAADESRSYLAQARKIVELQSQAANEDLSGLMDG